MIRDSLTPKQSVTFAEFPDTDSDCGTRAYSLLVPPHLEGVVSLQADTRTLSVQTGDKDLMGTHEFQLVVNLPDYPLAEVSFTKTLTVEISHICQTTSLLPHEQPLPLVEYQIKEPALPAESFNFEAIRDVVGEAFETQGTSCGPRDYVFRPNPDINNVIASFDPATRTVLVSAA